jgi:hypothetical protein
MVGYFGAKGTALDIPRNYNQLVNGVRPYPALSASSPIFAGRPLANIYSYDSIANSIYNGLWITVKKRFAKGLLLDSSYTFSKSIDDASRTNLNFAAGSQGPQDSNNIQGDRGLSDFDARHHWVLSGIYDLPFKGNRLVAGWEVATAVLLQSGNPINFHTNNTAFLGIGTLRPSVTGPVLADYTPATNRNAANVTYIQNPSVFYCGVPGNQTCTGAIGNTFGNLGRNVVIGPGFANLDVSLTKSTRLTEKLTWQVRADAFNLPNHPNFAQPSASNFYDTLGGATFNLLVNTRSSPGDSGSSRQIQLSMKLIF